MFTTNQVGANCADPLRDVLDQVCEFAKSSGLVQRESSKFCPKELLLSTLCLLGESRSTFHAISQDHHSHTSKPSPSPQAFHQRISNRPEEVKTFMELCINRALEASNALRKIIRASEKWRINRILIGDSSSIPLPKVLASSFPATGNTHGRVAGAKLNLTFDLLGYEVVQAEVITEQKDDKIVGQSVLEILQPNDLLIRDMGYYKAKLFQDIENQGAFWLTRLPASVQRIPINNDHSNDRALENVLESTSQDQLDLTTQLRGWQYPVRLVAIRASKDVVRRRLSELKKRYHQKGKTPPKRLLIRARWHIMIANLCKSQFSINDLCELYSQRWSIEIAFRSWKQSTPLGNLFKRKTSRAHVLLFLLAGVLKCVLNLHAYRSVILLHPAYQDRISLHRVSNYLTRILEEFRRSITLRKIPMRLLMTQKRDSTKSLNLLRNRLLNLLG